VVIYIIRICLLSPFVKIIFTCDIPLFDLLCMLIHMSGNPHFFLVIVGITSFGVESTPIWVWKPSQSSGLKHSFESEFRYFESGFPLQSEWFPNMTPERVVFTPLYTLREYAVYIYTPTSSSINSKTNLQPRKQWFCSSKMYYYHKSYSVLTFKLNIN